MASVNGSIRRALKALIPPPRLNFSEWIEQEVRLPEGTSALSGPVRLWEFQRGIADAIGDPELERVTVVKPVRVGYTTLLTGSIAAYVANDPSPILCLLPTDSDARDYVVSDVEPVFAETPAVARALSGPERTGPKTDAEPKTEDRNTLMARRFPGGSLKVVAAKSPRNLRRHNVRVLLMDECDAYGMTPEGAPTLLAEKRTLSFADRKIVRGSTPTDLETSEVLRNYDLSDRRVFECPCPFCGEFTEIQWAHIIWDEGKPETARFRCPHCEADVAETYKGEMVSRGRWRATKPEVKGHAGFRLNALVAPHANASWPKLIQEFLAAKSDPELLRTFVNTILGQGWSTGGEEIDDAALAARAQPWGLDKVPAHILCLTAGVDVQHDRLEVTVLGHSEDGKLSAMAAFVAWGPWDDDETWAELDAILTQKFDHELGGKIGISATAVDAGDGTTTKKVLSYAHARLGKRKVIPIKGAAGNRPVLERSKGKSKSGDRFWIVGVDTAKSQLFARLNRPDTFEFSHDLDPVWFEQLASEREIVRYVRGQPQKRFERIPGRRAEALDCVVYAMAAKHILNLDWDRLKADLSGVAEAKPKPEPKPKAAPWVKAPDKWF